MNLHQLFVWIESINIAIEFILLICFITTLKNLITDRINRNYSYYSILLLISTWLTYANFMALTRMHRAFFIAPKVYEVMMIKDTFNDRVGMLCAYIGILLLCTKFSPRQVLNSQNKENV